MSSEIEPETTAAARAAAPLSGCVSCGSPSAQSWDTRDGRVLMCQPCATMYDIGCP